MGWAAVCAVVLLAGCGASQSKPAAEAEGGETAPAEAGVQVASASELGAKVRQARGKVLVVNLWATWCPPCVAEMAELNAFYEDYAGADLRFLSISYDDPNDTQKVAAFHEDQSLSFPVHILGELDDASDIDKALGTTFEGVFPTTLVYNAAGEPVKVWQEAITREQLEEAVKPLLQ